MTHFTDSMPATLFSFMRKTAVVLVCMIVSLPVVYGQASGPAPAPAPADAARPGLPRVATSGVHPLTGVWSWSLFAGKCVETYDYRADGTLLSTSGEAVTVWQYSVTPNTSDKGFYSVKATSVRQNGKKDCYGDVVEDAGMVNQLFIQLSPKQDRFIACKEESLAACFGPLARVP